MEAQYVLGIDIGGTYTKIAIFTEKGNMCADWEIPTIPENGGSFVLSAVAQSVHDKLFEMGIPLSQVAGAGMGMPGYIDSERGTIVSSVNIGWKQYPAAWELSKLLEVPVLIDNDANLAAAGEYWQGAGKHGEDLLFLTIGTGIGCGIIIGGKVLYGTGAGIAGEAGHITVIQEGGETCKCGKNGCLETVASAPGIIRLAKREAQREGYSLLDAKKNWTTKDVFDLAEAGDRAAKTAVNKAMQYLGLAAANAAALLNPSRIVIGGGVSAAGEKLLTPLRKHFYYYALERVKQGTELQLAELGNKAGVTGAAWLALTGKGGQQ
ncbi:ROK family glucokinase [Bacillus piscicola]|uniref:ROK family glucokinase n=1 Tax=Bacillus piscicola TaxID=1632684 RepID=UPI001F08ED6E|nr:ROK family glucokinase [Bacillus piscicola]